MIRAVISLACAGLALAACASPLPPPPVYAGGPVQPDWETTPMDTVEMFPRVIEDVCFAALERDVAPAALIEVMDYAPAPGADDRFRTVRRDELYAATFASSPVLLSLAPDERRCDVVAISGDHETLKREAELVMERFDQRKVEGKPDHIAFIERAPHKGFAIRFSLLFGPDEIATIGQQMSTPVPAEQDDELPEDGIYVY